MGSLPLSFLDCEDAEPWYSQVPVYCPSIKDFLHLGSFCSCGSSVAVVRLVRRCFVYEAGGVIANLFSPIEEGKGELRPDSIGDYVDGLRSGQELVQTMTKLHLNASELKEIAFIFF